MNAHPGRMRNHSQKIEPTLYQSPYGRFRGWNLDIPGHHTLATPAVVNGPVFTGGGFGSYGTEQEFSSAFDHLKGGASMALNPASLSSGATILD